MTRRSGRSRRLLAAAVFSACSAASLGGGPAQADHTHPGTPHVHHWQGEATWTRDFHSDTGDFESDIYTEVTLTSDYQSDYGPGYDPTSFDFSTTPVVNGTFATLDHASGSETCDRHEAGTIDYVSHSIRQDYRSPGYFWVDMTTQWTGNRTYSGSDPVCTGTFPIQFNRNIEIRCGTDYEGSSYPTGEYSYKALPHNFPGVCTGSLFLDEDPTAPEPGLEVKISPIAQAATGASFPLTITVNNTSATEGLKGIAPAFPHGFGVANSYYAPQLRGELQVVAGPTPAFPKTLAPGASSVHVVAVKAAKGGFVGLQAKMSARGADSNASVTDTHYGQAIVGETQPADAERTAMMTTGAALFLNGAKKVFRDQQARYAQRLVALLKSRLSAKARKFYFGAKNSLKIAPFERALARLRGYAPELMALVTPNKRQLFKDGNIYLDEQQFARFQQLHNAEMLRLTEDSLGGALKFVGREGSYWAQLASDEGQGRVAADIALWQEMNGEDGQYLLAAIKESFTFSGAGRALEESDAALKSGFEKAVNGLLAAREARINKLVDLAESDPDAFIEQIANDSAGMGFEGFKLVAEQLMGDAAFKLAGKVFTGAKAAMTKFTKAVGASKASDAKALARTTLIGERSATLGPSYIDDLSEDAKTMIALRKMEAIGGMPLSDIEVTKDIVAKMNKRMDELGYDVEVELLFRPANPYKVANSFAKVEVVGVKNVAPIDLALGAPPSTLAETAIFKPRDPTTLRGWDNYVELDKTLLRERYKTRLSEYNQFHGKEPVTDKKMKAMLKSFDEVHTFDDIGQGREIRMKLSTEKVGDATVLKYDYLRVEGKVYVNGKGAPRSIGTDYDGAALINKNTRELLKGQELSAAQFELRRLGAKAAAEKGYANPFHDATAHGTDAGGAAYPFFAHYWLTHLKRADAIREAQRLAANYNRGRAAKDQISAASILAKTAGLFERYLLRVNAADASFGPANVVFRTPVVAP
ncbi:MAG TPA: hypothetical protein VD790_10060 [Thermoleophilaceae bacterium]|nr:hypothetical protein [Thermoleophilaceae bacterium]